MLIMDVIEDILDNKKEILNCIGWKIPNSRNYYSGIGLCNYRYPGLGEITNIDDLTQIKHKKFPLADLATLLKACCSSRRSSDHRVFIELTGSILPEDELY